MASTQSFSVAGNLLQFYSPCVKVRIKWTPKGPRATRTTVAPHCSLSSKGGFHGYYILLIISLPIRFLLLGIPALPTSQRLRFFHWDKGAFMSVAFGAVQLYADYPPLNARSSSKPRVITEAACIISSSILTRCPYHTRGRGWILIDKHNNIPLTLGW